MYESFSEFIVIYSLYTDDPLFLNLSMKACRATTQFYLLVVGPETIVFPEDVKDCFF